MNESKILAQLYKALSTNDPKVIQWVDNIVGQNTSFPDVIEAASDFFLDTMEKPPPEEEPWSRRTEQASTRAGRFAPRGPGRYSER